MKENKYPTYLIGYFIDYIKGTFEYLIKNEFKHEFAKLPKDCKIGFATVSSGLHMMRESVKNISGSMTPNVLNKIIADNIRWELSTVMMTDWVFNVKNDSDIMTLTNLRLIVNLYNLKQNILLYITDLDSFKSYLRMVVRHEIGHMIETISFNGTSESKYNNIFNQYDHEYDEFNKKNITDNYDEEYHKLPQEHLADMLGGVDIDELLKLCKHLDELPEMHKDMDIEINLVDKGDNNNEN